MESILPVVHLRDFRQRPKIINMWEKQRHKRAIHWAIQCFAEMLGTFFLVYAGVGSQTAWVLGNILDQPNQSSVHQIGFAYACGIIFGFAASFGTSGAHFNPCVTACFVVYRGFPKLRAVRYVIAQIFGAFIACSLVYAQYKDLIDNATAVLAKAGTLETLQFTPSGPSGSFVLYLPPGQSLGRAVLNEFVVDTFIGLATWAAMDPANLLVPPPFTPVIIALSYASAIWSFGTAGLAANAARDLGARLMAMTIWGTGAAGGRYAAIAALASIPAAVFAAGIYEFILVDSDRALPRASLEQAYVMMNHRSIEFQDTEKQTDTPSLVEGSNVTYGGGNSHDAY